MNSGRENQHSSLKITVNREIAAKHSIKLKLRQFASSVNMVNGAGHLPLIIANGIVKHDLTPFGNLVIGHKPDQPTNRRDTPIMETILVMTATLMTGVVVTSLIALMGTMMILIAETLVVETGTDPETVIREATTIVAPSVGSVKVNVIQLPMTLTHNANSSRRLNYFGDKDQDLSKPNLTNTAHGEISPCLCSFVTIARTPSS
jgi:hypothetical protein